MSNRGRTIGRGRNRGRGLYQRHIRQQKAEEGYADHVGLVYADDGQTVSSLQHLDPKKINLKILVWLTKPGPEDKPVIVAVSRFERRNGTIGAVGLDTKKYDSIYIPGDTPLYAHSY